MERTEDANVARSPALGWQIILLQLPKSAWYSVGNNNQFDITRVIHTTGTQLAPRTEWIRLVRIDLQLLIVGSAYGHIDSTSLSPLKSYSDRHEWFSCTLMLATSWAQSKQQNWPAANRSPSLGCIFSISPLPCRQQTEPRELLTMFQLCLWPRRPSLSPLVPGQKPKAPNPIAITTYRCTCARKAQFNKL